MSLHRLRALIKLNVTRFLHQEIAAFSSSPSSNPRFSFFSDETEEGSSAVYQHALTFQSPPVVPKQRLRPNSVSLIGTVSRPLQVIKTKDGTFGAHTSLRVENPRDPNRKFGVLLSMWDEIARSCVVHLKPNDFIYVSGRLATFSRPEESGNHTLHYKVNVTEVNYIAQPNLNRDVVEHEESSSGIIGVGEESNSELYLWQVFFANPSEWWDNRKSKSNPRQPDFKHKDTGEALWLSKKNPPWIERQLQLFDSKMAESSEQGRYNSRISTWVYDE